MKLLFDIGNTSIDWAIEDEGSFIDRGKNRHDEFSNLEQIKQHIELQTSQVPSHVLVSSVADGKVLSTLKTLAQQYEKCVFWQPQVVPSYKQLRNSYQDTNEMGIDRWLAMVAAWENYQAPLCLVICGTALTIDIINSNGLHLGGYIVPGIAMMQQSLVQNTEKINAKVDNTISIKLADNTQQAVTGGAGLACVATIDRVVEDFIHNFKLTPKCIISGGMAGLLRPALKQTFIDEPDIVLHGLSIMHKASQ